ncbi:MAG TPA: DUF5103 domain-containing protein [Bacteroidia bacterium]
MRDSVYHSNIQSVQLLRDNKPTLMPMIQLGSSEMFNLHFDDLNSQSDVYNYTMVLCDYDWNPSPLQQIMYLNGFFQGNITQMDFSMGTKQNYTHYTLDFPNSDMKPKFSGNYALVVYKNYDNNDTAFVKCFRVFEPILSLKGRIRDALNPEMRMTGQDITFTLDFSGIQNVNPRMDLFVDVYQNGRLDNARRNVKPALHVGNIFTFDNLDNSLTFEGANEWRFLDLRTLRQKTNITRDLVEGRDGLMVSYLFPLPARGEREYTPLPDLNGTYFIETRDGFDSNTEGDYSYVRFSLAYDKGPNQIGDVYVLGQLSNYDKLPEFKMEYDPEMKEYFLTKKLKTGYYNFMFVNDSPFAQISPTRLLEGDFARTENMYIVLVYYRDRYQRTDRIVAATAFSTITDR